MKIPKADKEALELLAARKYDEAIERLLKKDRRFTKSKPGPLLRLWVRKNRRSFLSAILDGFYGKSLVYDLNEIEKEFGKSFRQKLEESLLHLRKELSSKKKMALIE